MTSKQQKEVFSEDRNQDKDQKDQMHSLIDRDRGDGTFLTQDESGDREMAERQEVEETNAMIDGNMASRHREQLEQVGDHGNAELIQHLLSQQLQQQQVQLNQQPQSALQQLLSQHHQRDHHPAMGQLSLEDAHRLLQHQSHSHQHVLSHLVPWLSASQLLHTQTRIQQAQAAATLQQQDNGHLTSVSDIADGKSVGFFAAVLQVLQSTHLLKSISP